MPPSSERHGKIYCLPVPFLKRTNNLAISCAGMAKQFANKHNACAELSVCSPTLQTYCFFEVPVAFSIVVCQGPYYHSNTTPETKVKMTLSSVKTDYFLLK